MDVEEFLKRDVNRRQFLDRSARNAAGMAAGVVGLASNMALADSAPNERVVLAGIGMRGQGKFLTSSMAAFPDVHIKTICDVDEAVIPAAVKSRCQNKPIDVHGVEIRVGRDVKSKI